MTSCVPHYTTLTSSLTVHDVRVLSDYVDEICIEKTANWVKFYHGEFYSSLVIYDTTDGHILDGTFDDLEEARWRGLVDEFRNGPCQESDPYSLSQVMIQDYHVALARYFESGRLRLK